MSPREELMKRIDDLCGLNPKAIGVGGGIDRQSSPLWRLVSQKIHIAKCQVATDAQE